MATFRPVGASGGEERGPGEERYRVSSEAAALLARARAGGGRVWAVGTTVVRTLESAADGAGGVRAGCGTTDLFIRPPFRFHVVDALITNFHLPHSTLLMLVAAFAGRERTMAAYREAIDPGLSLLLLRRRDGDRVSGDPASAFSFALEARTGHARAGVFSTPHGDIETPAFMPVGTLANVKMLTPDELDDLGARMVLANTYHLHLRPGAKIVRQLGGLHAFMRWPGPILTDSGGFQVFSLARINRIHDDGVVFRSHIDGSAHHFTPERVIDIQRALGADVVMAFDECPPADADHAAVARANRRTLAWLERCAARFRTTEGDAPAQALFPVLQGGVFDDLRRGFAVDARGVADWPGFGIGGLSVGERKDDMWRVLELLDGELPAYRPRYLMGVGYPDDLLEAVARGCDLFDCVAPTRNARHGTAWTSDEGQVNMKGARFRTDTAPLDGSCACYACRRFDRAYLRHLLVAGEGLAQRLLSIHNLSFLVRLAGEARRRIVDGSFGMWRAEWLLRYRSARAKD